jgi:hypothetical protein
MNIKLYLFAVVLLLKSIVSFSQEENEKLKAQVNFDFGTKLNVDKYQIDEQLSAHDLRINPHFFTTTLGLQVSKGNFFTQLGGGYANSDFRKNNNGSNWRGLIIDFELSYQLFDDFKIGAAVQSETSSLTLYSRSESEIDITKSLTSSSVQLSNSFWSFGPMISTDISICHITIGYLFNVYSGDWKPLYNDLPSNRIAERGGNQLYAKFEFTLFKLRG